nr:endonuclease/exonuclease/phosphatase family protein [Cognatishimia maritima]
MLLRDILAPSPQVANVTRTIATHQPDVLVLQDMDWDLKGAAVHALQTQLKQVGTDMPYAYVPPSNTGLPMGIDMDADGKTGGPRDTQGYGRFPGQGSIAILSRLPIDEDAVQEFHALLWKDIASPKLLEKLLPPEAIATQRLASVFMAAVPIETAAGPLWVLTHHATPPVFDGPEDRNGHRNAAENLFWLQYLDGTFGTRDNAPFVIASQLNIDPIRGEGHKETLSTLLSDPRLQDPFATGPSEDHHTAAFDSVGKLRLAYLLPSSQLNVSAKGHSADPALRPDQTHSRHRLIWIDVEIPD